MISLGSNRIEFVDLHFLWDVPEGEVNGGCLISINHNHLVRMIDGSITIRNSSQQDGVYAFDVVTAPEQQSAVDVDSEDADALGSALPLVAIQLYNVIVRGQMTMIHMDYAASLQLQWDNGLLAISRRMIETSGARTSPPLTSVPIQLSLTRLTAHIPQGLLRMQLMDSEQDDSRLRDESDEPFLGRFPVAIDREAQGSVFVVNEGVPTLKC